MKITVQYSTVDDYLVVNYLYIYDMLNTDWENSGQRIYL